MTAYNLPIGENPLQSRNDLRMALTQLIHPLKPYYSEGFARLHLGHTSASYADDVAEMEGFSRVLWGLVPLLAGGDHDALWEICLLGIIHGTDPTHEEYWGSIQDYDQRIVEMAAFGYALALIPERIWEPLNEQEKHNLYAWLNQINDHRIYDCNWLFFNVLVNLGFKKVGAPYDRKYMEKNLQRIDSFYLQDGWYADGVQGHSDYYVPFAIHFYSLIYAKLMEEEDPGRSQLYKERAKLFAQDFIYWFSADGSAIPYGRSMTYRFAQSAFWSALVYAGVEPFPLGVLKGVILRNLRWWFYRPIFASDGTLTIGYAYPNLVMAENYNSPGSPYWALKGFLPLALPEDHSFWQCVELPLPELNLLSVQRAPHLVVCRQKENNHVLAFNSGHGSTNEHTHTSAKYEKFAYSTFFGFSVPRAEWGLAQGAYDSMLALSEGDHLYRVKRKCEDVSIDGDVIYAKWKPWADVEVRTWIIAGAPWHIRVHHIRSRRNLDAAEGGFALGIEPFDQEWEARFQKKQQLEVSKDNNQIFAVCPWGVSGIRNLYGYSEPQLIYPNSNTNLIHSRTVIPTLKASLTAGEHWLAAAVYGEPSCDLRNQGNKEGDSFSLDTLNNEFLRNGRTIHLSEMQVEIRGNEFMLYSKADQQIIFQQKI